MLLADLAACWRDLAATASRRRKLDRLAGILRRLQPDEIAIAVGLLRGEPRQGRLHLSGRSFRDAATLPAAEPTLDLVAVDAALIEIAGVGGHGAQRARIAALGSLLTRATADEQAFLEAALLGALRQGATEGLVTEAVAQAAAVDPGALRSALMLAGDLGSVARAALVEGAAGLARFRLTPFRPVLPMLAQPVETPGAAVEQLGAVAVDWKLDGARIQVHKQDDELRIYTRNQRDVTAALPEVAAALRTLPARELILDGEALALHADGTPQPFQTTMRRFGRRAAPPDELVAQLPLSSFCFDCLLLDGESLLDHPAHERFAALDQAVPAELRTPRFTAEDASAVGTRFTEALAAGHEGLMVKQLDAPYTAGSRGGAWLKLKPAHSLDLVVLAAEWGNGRREGWLSNLHLGARDPAAGGFVMLGKTFKGMDDRLLAWQTRELLARELGREGETVHVTPELVVEVACSDVQASPHYPGGVALRFARVLRYREDKAPQQADTIDAVRALLPSGL